MRALLPPDNWALGAFRLSALDTSANPTNAPSSSLNNRLPELASWNKDALQRELSFLSDLDVDYDFSAIGFDTAEVDFIIDGPNERADPADAAPTAGDAPAPAVSRPGDLW